MEKLVLKENIAFNVVGPDGGGKDSAMALVLPQLENFETFREPGGTPEAEMIREILLTVDENKRTGIFTVLKSSPILPKTRNLLVQAENEYLKGNFNEMEVYLFAASRSETNDKVVKKFLSEGKSVVGSRSVSCSMAYQVGARGLDFDFVWDTNQKAIDRLPDFEIFLDVPTEVAMERISKRTGKQDRLDLEGFEFHQKSRQGYIDFFKMEKYPVFRVDGTQTIEKVAEDILKIIKENAI